MSHSVYLLSPLLSLNLILPSFMSCCLSQMVSQYLSDRIPVKRSSEHPVFLGAEKIVGSPEQWGENCD